LSECCLLSSFTVCFLGQSEFRRGSDGSCCRAYALMGSIDRRDNRQAYTSRVRTRRRISAVDEQLRQGGYRSIDHCLSVTLCFFKTLPISDQERGRGPGACHLCS